MKFPKVLMFVLFLLNLNSPLKSQDNSVVLQRTPEQEASKQTEKLQQELNLSTDQTKQVYEINLHYARERKVSNTRSEAIERMKNKNADIQRVLNTEQNERLQTKRYQRTSTESATMNRNQPGVSSGFRAPAEYRSNGARIPSSEMNLRQSYRSSAAPQSGQQVPQTVRKSTQPAMIQQSTPSVRSAQPPQSVRSSSGSAAPTRRSEPASSSRRR